MVKLEINKIYKWHRLEIITCYKVTGFVPDRTTKEDKVVIKLLGLNFKSSFIDNTRIRNLDIMEQHSFPVTSFEAKMFEILYD